MGTYIVTDADRLRIADQCHDLLGRVKAGLLDPLHVSTGLQSLITGTPAQELAKARGRREQPKKVDLAEERRAAIEANFRACGFEISVPKPNVSNTALKRWRREGRELFYRPATALVSYEAWMTAHGQAKHWTVADEADRAKVGWESTAEGYWFTAEIAPACPRLDTSWNDLTAAAVKLLIFEEYVIVYWTHRDLTGGRLDISTWCWLRTRYGLSALVADDCGGGVSVRRSVVGVLAIPDGSVGGRAVEVVLAPAA